MKTPGVIYLLSGLALIAADLFSFFASEVPIGVSVWGALVWGVVAFALLWQARELILLRPKARIGAIISSVTIAGGSCYMIYLLLAPNFSEVPQPVRLIVCTFVVIALAHGLAALLLLRARAPNKS